MLNRILTIALCVLMTLASFSVFVCAEELTVRTVKIGVAGNMEPLLFVENDTAKGAFCDMMAYIAEKSGYQIEYVVYRLPLQALVALEASEIDAVLGIWNSPVSDYPSLEMTRELYAAELCSVSAKSNAKYASYEKGTVDVETDDLPEVFSYYVLPNQETVLNYLIDGYSDSIFALWDCVSCRLTKEGLKNAYTISTGNLGVISYGIAVRNTNIIMKSSFNSAITALRNDSAYDAILRKWDIRTEVEAANIRTSRLIRIISYIAVGAALIVFTITAISMRLRSLVAIKTAELSEKVEDLENSSSLRNALIEQSSAGSMVLKLDGSILLMNDAMRRLADISPDETVTNIEELALINEVWEISPPEMDQPALFNARSADGQNHTYRYQNHRTSNHDERVFIIEDITREEAEKQRAFEEDKNRALNRIIAGLAHEIKNPLTTLKAYAYLAESPDNDPDFYESFSRYVPSEINRIGDLVESLVNYSRPVRGQVGRIKIADVTDSCLGLAYVTSKNRITIESNVDCDLYIRSNADQLRQALLNLLLNSIESIEQARAEEKEKCLIRLSAYRRGENAVIEVFDSGTGMNSEQISSCTDPFFTTKNTGTGMGLAMVRQYVKENDGALEIESVEGEYTVMRMVFAEDKGND